MSSFFSICSLLDFKWANNFLFTRADPAYFCSVLMKGITWSRDSHGLFDYESRHLTKKTLKSANESMIMRSVNELQLSPYNRNQSFLEQCDAAKRGADDMAMLKIVNHNEKTFYLESAAYLNH